MKSLEKIVKEYGIKHECLVLLIRKLQLTATSKALISAMRICCRLGSFIPQKFSNEVAKVISENISHKSICVRTQSAIELREILIEGGYYDFAATSSLKKLLKDPQNSVQVFAFESLCTKQHSKGYFHGTILPLLLNCLEIKNWRIRYTFVRYIVNFIGLVEGKHRKVVVNFFSKCLSDSELEVSILALKSIKSIQSGLELDEITEKILPELTQMLTTENLEIKIALCESVSGLSTSLIKSNEGLTQLKSIINQLIKDQNPEVRVALFSNIDIYLKSINSGNTTMMFKTYIQEMMGDKSWKIRMTAIKAYENLIIKFAEDFSNDEKILKFLQEKLVDRIANIRKTAVLTLKKISSALGTHWCEKYCLPLFVSFIENQNYLYRINYLFGVGEIYGTLSAPVQTKQNEQILKLTKDPVPNIRSQAFLLLLRLVKTGEDKNLEEKLRKSTEPCLNDNDLEVKRIAKMISLTKDLKSINEGPFEIVVT